MLSGSEHLPVLDANPAQPLQSQQPRQPARPEPHHSELSASAVRAALDELDIGIVLTALDGTVLLANRAARRACQAPAALRIDTPMLGTTDSADLPGLQQALFAVRQGRRSMLNFRRPDGTTAVGVLPVTDQHTGQRVAMLVLGKPARQASLNVQFFCQTHRLTLAESAVLRSLVLGLTPRQVAEAGGVTVATVRSQITAIREKTHSASLNHLLRQVASLPPLAAAGTLDH